MAAFLLIHHHQSACIMSLAGRPCASKSAIALDMAVDGGNNADTRHTNNSAQFAAGIEHKAVFRTASPARFYTLQLRHCAGNCLNLSSPNTAVAGNLPFLQLSAEAYSPVELRINIVIAGVNVAVVFNNHQRPQVG